MTDRWEGCEVRLLNGDEDQQLSFTSGTHRYISSSMEVFKLVCSQSLTELL